MEEVGALQCESFWQRSRSIHTYGSTAWVECQMAFSISEQLTADIWRAHYIDPLTELVKSKYAVNSHVNL